MLTVEQNEELTRVGPGTRMGELLRRYWYPIAFEQDFDERLSKSLHGLTRTLVNNMVVGVTEGYEKKLEIVGVGYRVL